MRKNSKREFVRADTKNGCPGTRGVIKWNAGGRGGPEREARGQKEAEKSKKGALSGNRPSMLKTATNERPGIVGQKIEKAPTGS